jgi:hypothetical protein
MKAPYFYTNTINRTGKSGGEIGLKFSTGGGNSVWGEKKNWIWKDMHALSFLCLSLSLSLILVHNKPWRVWGEGSSKFSVPGPTGS